MPLNAITYPEAVLFSFLVALICEISILFRFSLAYALDNRESLFDAMFTSGYRIFWFPKISLFVTEIALATKIIVFYSSGGQGRFWAVLGGVGLIGFAGLVCFESVRALRSR